CGPPHIAPFTPRKRAYNVGNYAQASPAAKPSTGSLYSDAAGGYLEDTRALRVGDVVIVKIDENAGAQGNATTKLDRSSNAQAGMDAFMGMMASLKASHPNIDPAKLMSYAAQAQFAGDGNTTRTNQLTASIAVRVTREMPNGDLFVEG